MVDAYVAAAASSKEDFLNAVLDERKWEFAGENMRWKDLVRNNKYSEKVLMTFLSYYAIAESQSGSSGYMDMVSEYDGVDYNENFVYDMFSILVKNYNDPNFPNRNVYMFYVVNPYSNIASPTSISPAKYLSDAELDYEPVSQRAITGLTSQSNNVAWTETNLAWGTDGNIRNQIRFSMYGYVRTNEMDEFIVVNNGTNQRLNVNTSDIESNFASLPPVRYLLPIPEEAIARSSGAYRNYYGY